MAEFAHFLITRFNIGLYSAGDMRDKSGRPANDAWMDHRFKLFDAFCLPSVKNQTNNRFSWVVLFDSKTPEKYRAIIENQKNKCVNFVPLFVDLSFGEDTAPMLQKYILDNITADVAYVITTRLDCDDALNVSTIESIQQYFNRQKFKPLNFLNGYFYDLADDTVHEAQYDSNPFVSLIERIKKSGITTVMDRVHGEWFERKNIVGPRMWIQVVHDRNLMNLTHGRKTQLRLTDLENDFRVDAAKAAEISRENSANKPNAGAAAATETSAARQSIFSYTAMRIRQSRYASRIRVYIRKIKRR
jgi:hypothetical protein